MRTILWEGKAQCPYCLGECYEVLEAEDGEAKIACAWCGKDIRRVYCKKTQKDGAEEKEFQFNSGRHKGKTLEEVFILPGGERYLRYLQEKAESEKVKQAVTKFLEAQTIEG